MNPPETNHSKVLAVSLRKTAITLFVLFFGTCCLAADLTVYDDDLRGGWLDYSWAQHDLFSSSQVHSGAFAVAFEPDAWEAFYPHRPAGVDTTQYESIRFWVHGGDTGGQLVHVIFVAGQSALANVNLDDHLPGGTLPPDTWVEVEMGFDDLGISGTAFDGIYFQGWTGGDQPTVYLDDIVIVESTVPPEPVTVAVDPDTDRRPISPLIYGVNRHWEASETTIPYPLWRWGGNATTRYSWEDDVSNRGSDWFFTNYANDTDVSALPDDSTADRFIDDILASSSEMILTIPLIGWTPLDRVRRWGYSVAKYGPQQTDECTATGGATWCNADMGNGVQPDGTPITWNDPGDTSRPIGPDFVTRWMGHIAGRVGPPASGGVRYYALDNEPMLWSYTHQDVHPNPLDYAEIWDRTEEYAAAIKEQDPGAVTLGPALWGWCAYFWSDSDGCGNNGGPDYSAHGPFLEWYLSRAAEHEAMTGIRILDYLDIHYYPQGDGVSLSNDETGAVAALRLRSTRSLYDPGYVDESWIGEAVRLIPRMKEIIDRNYPGTKLSLTEYNWGNDEGISSALAQVEVLAILGREGVDLATRWVAPAIGSSVEEAFRLYLDYDGAGSQVMGESVRAECSNVGRVGAYAVRSPEGKLYIVLVNKSTLEETVEMDITGSATGDLQLFGFDADNPLGPVGVITAKAENYTLTLPPRSARLAVAALAADRPGDCSGDGTVTIGEVQRAINMFLGVEIPKCGVDENGDGSVSIGEVQRVINAFLQ